MQIKIVDKKNLTKTFIKAVEEYRVNTVENLIQFDIDIDNKKVEELTDNALDARQLTVAKLLIDKFDYSDDFKITILSHCIIRGAYWMLDYLFKKYEGLDLSKQNNKLLDFAIRSGNDEAARALLKHSCVLDNIKSIRYKEILENRIVRQAVERYYEVDLNSEEGRSFITFLM